MSCWKSSVELKQHVNTSLKKIGIQPSRYKGQNFLIDPEIIRYQIEHAQIQNNEIILEIGGGVGNLSKCLVDKVKKLYIIELDRRIANFLSNEMSNYSNVEIIQGDAVKVDFPVFTKCVSNLPYQISSPITFKLLNHNFKLSILMYQREFAERMIAKPNSKNYSRLSVMINLLANCAYLRTIRPSSFYPIPRVYSSLIFIKKKEKVDVEDIEDFRKFTTLLFINKKKTVRNIIINHVKRMAKKGKTVSKKAVENITFLKRRVFSLSLNEIIEVYNQAKKIGENIW